MSLQSLFARATMKTMEGIEKIKQDAEKSLGLEIQIDDPIFKELQSFIVEEEDVVEEFEKLANDFINSVSLFSKKEITDFSTNMKLFVKSRGTVDEQTSVCAQLDEYRDICSETVTGSESVGSWVVVEIQTFVLNPIEKLEANHQKTKSKFWKLKELRRHLQNLAKILDKKGRIEHAQVLSDVANVEKELLEELIDKKANGVAYIHNIWNEYCRIEAEYFSKMNDAYLEQTTTPHIPLATTITKNADPWLKSPVIAGSEEESDSQQ